MFSMGLISKWTLSPYKGKWQQSFSEKQALGALKKRLAAAQEPNTTSVDFLSSLIDCFRSYSIDPTPSAYAFLFRYLLHKRIFSQLHPILNHLEKAERFETSETIFANIIRAYGNAGMLRDAVDIFFRIPKFRCSPSSLSLNSLLYVLCKRKEGLVFVPDVLMRTPSTNIRLDSSSLKILMRALCMNNRVSDAIELFDVMQKSDEYTADARTYSLILNALCKQATSVEVMDFLKHMWDRGFVPNRLECTSVINLLVREGRANDAYDILTRMKLAGVKPDVMIYSSVLEGFVFANDFQKADDLFDELLLMGIVPGVATYNAYISGLCKQGDLEGACRMVVLMERAGCIPDVESFNVLVEGYCKIPKLGKAREVMDRMLEKGLRWNARTYRLLIDGLLCEGEAVEACKTFVGMLSEDFTPPPSICHDLVCALCNKGLLSAAVQVLEEMTSRSITPDASSWKALLVALKLRTEETSIDLLKVTEASPCHG